MPKDSDPLNHKNNSNISKMIAIPPTPQVEELTMPDEEQATPENAQPYEDRMNDKLRELGLYEDGMTMQQKEELLAVVVASWQTAEEEKSRRQFYQDYVNASEAFCNDQIEFSFKDSPECSNQNTVYNFPQYYDMQMQAGNSSDSYPKDMKAKSVVPNGDINQPYEFTADMPPDVSFDNYEDTNCTASSTELFTSSQETTKVLSPLRLKRKRGSSIVEVVAPSTSEETQSTTNIQRVKESQFLDTKFQPKIESNEHCISIWEPCLSPKDESLSCSKKPWLTQTDSSCDSSSEEDETTKILDLVKTLDYARISSLKCIPKNQKLSTSYHLNRNGLFAKKYTDPDPSDIWVGVPPKVTQKFLDCKEPFSRTSSGAFRYVQAKKAKEVIPDYEAHTTRSGLKYGLYDTEGQSTTNDDSKWPSCESPVNLYSEVEVILDENLPKFSDLKPSLFGEGCSDVGRGDSAVEAQCSTSEVVESINHNAGSSHSDNDSSDGSVIDVETIVDNEIEEFVLKRKKLQEYQSAEKEPNTSQSKKFKKNS